MTIIEAARRLLSGSPIERATVDLVNVTEAHLAKETSPEHQPTREPKTLTAKQLRELRKNRHFRDLEAATTPARREIAKQRKKYKLDTVA